jgi:hypothetical protein
MATPKSYSAQERAVRILLSERQEDLLVTFVVGEEV